MEPGGRGSGLVFDTNCSEDMLDKNWQGLFNALSTKEISREFNGLTRITDMKLHSDRRTCPTRSTRG